MVDSINLKIEKLTILSHLKRKSLINWFGRQNCLIQNDIFQEQKNQFFKLKQNNEASDILALSSFFLAIETYYNMEQLLKKKNKSSDLKNIKKLSDFSLKQTQKVTDKPIRDALLNHWSIVQNMKNVGSSYRQIEVHLLNVYNISVSHTYILNLWKEIEDES